MFDKKVVLYLTRKKIWSRDLATPKPKLIEREWDGVDPTAIFKEVKDTFKPQSVKIILGDDLSYVTLLEISGDTVSRDVVFNTAMSLLPIELSDNNFDWKLVSTNSQKKLFQIQVFAISQEILNSLSYAAKLYKLNIESMTPISLLIATESRDTSDPQLISWSGQEQLAVLAYKGNVYLSESILKSSDAKLKSLTKFAKDRFNFTVTPMIKQSFDALAAIIHQKVSHGQDKDTLGIMLLPNPSEPKTFRQAASPKEVTNTLTPPVLHSKFTVRKVVVVASFLFAIIITFVSVGLYQQRFKDADVKNQYQITLPTVVPSTGTTQNETSENEVDVSLYSVQVLNGSGIAGEATQVVDILRAEGFTTLEIDNADSYNHTNTQVQMKESVPKGIFTIVERSLNSEYSVVETEALTTNAKYDLIIIVGARQNQ